MDIESLKDRDEQPDLSNLGRPTPQEQPEEERITIKDNGNSTDIFEQHLPGSSTTLKSGPAFPCGCTMTEPHSHLVAGHSCECEKGRPNNYV